MSLHVNDNYNGSLTALKKTGSSHGVSGNVDVANHQQCICPLYHRAASKLLPPQGFGPEAKTRGGILGFPACIHIRNFKM